MELLPLPTRRYALPLDRPVHGARDHHQLLCGSLIGYRLGPHQGWMTAADLPGRPQWRAAIERFAHAAARQAAQAAAQGLSWPEALAQRWGTRLRSHVALQWTGDFADLASGAAAEALRHTGCRAIKLKVTPATDERALQREVPRFRAEFADVELRLDANQSWGQLAPAVLRQRLQLCAELGVTLCEDPTAPEDWPVDSPLPLAADLVDSDAAALRRLARAGALQLAVIKPSLCGDPEQCLELVEEMTGRGVQVALSSLFDAPLGLAMLGGLAAALPGPIVASGLATHLALPPPWNPPQLRPQEGQWRLRSLFFLGSATVPGAQDPSSGPGAGAPAAHAEPAAAWLGDPQRALPADPWAQAAALSPEAAALTWAPTAETWSYATLDRQIDAAGAWLAAQGVVVGSAVLLWADNCPELAVALAACARIGAVAVPLHPRLQPVELQALSRRVAAKLCLHDAGHAPLGPGWQPLGAWRDTAVADCPRRAGELAALVATSGTTGQPKLAMLSTHALLAAAHGHWAQVPAAPSEVWLACLPLCHVSGLLVLWRAAVIGAAVLLTADASATATADALQRFAPTTLSVVPTQLVRLLERGVAPASLQTVLVGGASCDPRLLGQARAAGWPVRASFGMTETSAQLASATAEEPLEETGGLRRVGPLLPGMAARLLGSADEGEIAVAGPQLFSGYWGQAEPAFVYLDGEPWFCTGDHGRIGAAGELWVASRRSDRLMRGGENIDPLEVEAALGRVPQVIEVAVAGVADAQWGEQVGAWLVVADASAWTPAACAAALAQLAPFKRPTVWKVTSTPLPRNSLGKLLRAAVREALQAQPR